MGHAPFKKYNVTPKYRALVMRGDEVETYQDFTSISEVLAFLRTQIIHCDCIKIIHINKAQANAR